MQVARPFFAGLRDMPDEEFEEGIEQFHNAMDRENFGAPTSEEIGPDPIPAVPEVQEPMLTEEDLPLPPSHGMFGIDGFYLHDIPPSVEDTSDDDSDLGEL